MSHIKGAVQITFDPSRHVHEARMSFYRASIAVEYRQSPWSGLACALIASDRGSQTQRVHSTVNLQDAQNSHRCSGCSEKNDEHVTFHFLFILWWVTDQ